MLIRSKQNGDTLVEVVLSIAIISVVLVTAFNIANLTFRIGVQARERTEASHIAQKYAETMIAARDQALDTIVLPSALFGGGHFASPQTYYEGPGSRYRVVITTTTTSRVDGTASTPMLNTVINVSWESLLAKDPTNRNEVIVGLNLADLRGLKTIDCSVKGSPMCTLASVAPPPTGPPTGPPPSVCPGTPGTAFARDCERIADITSIRVRLASYASANGNTLPTTASYGESNAGGWDYSSQGNFLNFLAPPAPKDPINNGTGDVFYPTLGGTGYAYAYYCYNTSWPAFYHNKLAMGTKLEDAAPFIANPTTSPHINNSIYWHHPSVYETTGYTCV